MGRGRCIIQDAKWSSEKIATNKYALDILTHRLMGKYLHILQKMYSGLYLNYDEPTRL